MGYEVTKDKADYTWVLTQQVEHIARVATEYFKTPRAKQPYKLAELKGAVKVLLDLANPVLKAGSTGYTRSLNRLGAASG